MMTPTLSQVTVAVKAGGSGVAPSGQFDALDVIQIPEPAAVLLGFAGLVAILKRRRR